MSNQFFNIEEFKVRFLNALENQCGVTMPQRLLVAVSGGADSVALLHLLKSAGADCVVAHCNFSLRGAESDGDELFVRELCNKIGVVCIVKRFNTKGYAALKGVSIEMAARELRYQWFSEIMQTEKISLVATGHHGNDAIETFFLNLARGTGIKGLTGIAWKRGVVVRPLLFAQASEIIDYCRAIQLDYRTDSTNTDVAILRNKIRHQIIPLFNQVNPAFFLTMQHNMGLLKEVSEVFSNDIEVFKEQFVASTEDGLLIPISKVKEHPQKRSLLYEVLSPYGFNSAVIDEIVKGLDATPGRQYFSDSHRLVRDRYNLILTGITAEQKSSFYLQADETDINEPIKLKIREFDKEFGFQFSTNPKIAHFDADLIDFPLELRKWHKGDSFQPLGMACFKKLSDFFINEKYSLIQKENLWLLISNSDIIWIVGKRMDNRYKVTQNTKRILEISLV